MRKKITTLIIICLCALSINAQKIEATKVWKEYSLFQGIKIEYKFAPCSNTSTFKNQVLVLFKFTNTTSEKVKLSWNLEKWRDNVCSNCERLTSPENSMSIILNPKQIIEGNCFSSEFKERYFFSNFIKLSPGMSKQHLTNFKFQNLTKNSL